MSDDKTKRGPQDANRINLSEDYEVQYWTNRFSVSKERLQEVVDRVGVSVDAVATALNGDLQGEARPPLRPRFSHKAT